MFFLRGVWNLSCKSVDSKRKFLLALSKLHSSLLKNRFWWKKNFVQKIVTSTFWNSGIFFRIFGNNDTAGLPKFRGACSDEHLEEKYFCLGSAQFFHPLRNSSKYFSEFCWQIFGRVVKIGFYMYIAAFWRNIFTLQRIHIFFRRFRDLIGKSVDFWRKIFAIVVKIAFSVAEESFLMKKWILSKKMYFHLFSNLGVCFVFLPTMLRQACQNIIVHVQTNILTNRFFGKLINFSSFPDFEQKFSEIWREFFGTVVTTAFCVSRSIFFFSIFEGRKWGKKFFEKVALPSV